MTTVRDASGLNESCRRAAFSSAFPPALPPKPPATSPNIAVYNNGNAVVVPPLIREGGGATALQHPLITAADYSDRNRLLSHISFLSGQLQRADLLLQNAPRTMVSEEELARFDPVVAQRHVDRLDSALSQISLLREVEIRQKHVLEEELQGLREERNRVVERVDTLESRVAALETENKELRNALSSAQLEVERLRLEESNLNRRLSTIDKLQEDGGRYQGVNVIVAPPRRAEPHIAFNQAMEHLHEEEAVQRLSLLLDMMMEPIYIAFDAGVVWITETQLHRASVQIHNEVVPEVHNDSDELPTIARVKTPLGAAVDASVPSFTDHAALLQRQQEICTELEALRESYRIADERRQWLQRLLYEEQQRTESMAREHCQQLEQVHEQVVQERRHIMESLAAEVEEKMRNAFRDGRLHERRLIEEKQERRQLSSIRANSVVARHHGTGKSARCVSSILEDSTTAGKVKNNKKKDGFVANTGSGNGSSRSSSSSTSVGLPIDDGRWVTGRKSRGQYRERQ